MSNYITYNPYITSTKKGGVSAVFLSKKSQNFHISNTSQATVKEYVYYGLGLYSFTGKERDSETGFSYFGARYYDSDLMTSWLSVDPMADKYPSLSPYAYCGWNPVRLVDPDGRMIGDPPTWVRTVGFALRHPNIASSIGVCRPGESNTNISTRSERFATRGKSHSDPNTIFRKNGCAKDFDPCSEIGAFRHTLWQATIASYYGRDIATEVGNAHEDNPSTNLSVRNFSSMAEADQVVDLLNNMLGRIIGEQNPNCPMNELAGKVAEYFYTTGLYIGTLNEDKTWSVHRTKITKEQYDSYMKVLEGLDFNGFNSSERATYRAKCERVNQAIKDAGLQSINK